MTSWSEPRHTTDEEREEMARVAKQRLEAMRATNADERRKQKKNKRKPPTRYCKVCKSETEHGCPDCRAYLCDPWQRGCYELHRGQAHAHARHSPSHPTPSPHRTPHTTPPPTPPHPGTSHEDDQG